MDEVTNKTKLWDNNLGRFHICDQNPYEKRKKLDDWQNKFDQKTKFLVPIWCNICKVAYKPNSVCGHILRDGFKEGVDSVKFYSDHPKMVERRNLIKKELKNTAKPRDQNLKTFF